MNDIAEKVRETFNTVGGEVPVPPFDEPGYRRRVARARRRHHLRVTVGVAAAASVATVAAYAGPDLVDGDLVDGARDGTGTANVAAEPPDVHPGALRKPLYFTAGSKLMAVTPNGQVHDLGLRSEAVVGFTAEGVFAFDSESRLIWFQAKSSREEDGAFTFTQGKSPVPGPVQSAALSSDGRYLAWLDLSDTVSVIDLKTGAQVSSARLTPNSAVTSVSARGVLVSEDGHLRLLEKHGAVEVPTADDGYGLLSEVSRHFVSVADRDDVTRVYDVTKRGKDDSSNGTAELVTEVPGTGRLAADGRSVVTVAGSSVGLWRDRARVAALTGLKGAPQSAGWYDEDNAVVTTAESGGTSLYVCPVADLTCTRVAFSVEDVRLR